LANGAIKDGYSGNLVAGMGQEAKELLE
jgi:hypothetical protein